MKVLVTGASGFVGAAIAGVLSRRGYAVRAGTRDLARIAAGPGITPWALPDLAAPVDWRPHLDGVDAVVHAAGLAHQPPGADEASMLRLNADAAGELATAAAAAGIDRFVLISSIRAITGAAAGSVLAETDMARPTDPYGRSKLAGEHLVREALPAAVILRPPVVHGAGAKANMARLARLARLHLPLPLGGLTGRRSVVSDRNLAAATAFVLTTSQARGELFHVDDGRPLTLPEMIAVMRRALGRGPALFSLPSGLEQRLMRLGAPAFHDQLCCDLVVSSSALAAAGWTPEEPSTDGLARLVRAAG